MNLSKKQLRKLVQKSGVLHISISVSSVSGEKDRIKNKSHYNAIFCFWNYCLRK